jgi:hypothetical protein
MCGATQQQQQVSDEQNAFYKQLTQQYSTIFGQSQAITGALTQAYLPILQAGPSQTGFAPGEENALRTQNTENVATNYAQAQRATAQVLAAQGGGDTLLPSSINANILAQNTNLAAAQRTAGENTITQANYARGYGNWQQAAGVLGSTAGLINPTSYAGATTSAGGAAMQGATDIANAANSPWNAAFGALGAIGGAAAGNFPMPRPGGGGGGFSGLPPCWIAAELFGGWNEPRTVLVRNWLIHDFSKRWIGRQLLKIYVKYGERTAAMIHRYPALRMIFAPPFNLALRQAQGVDYAR